MNTNSYIVTVDNVQVGTFNTFKAAGKAGRSHIGGSATVTVQLRQLPTREKSCMEPVAWVLDRDGNPSVCAVTPNEVAA